MTAEQRLARRFLELPYRLQHQAARNSGLLGKLDHLTWTDDELYSLIFRRAVERGRLAELWTETERLHPDPADENPFASK